MAIGGVQVIMNPAGLAELLRSPSGPVVRDLLVKANLVKREAQRLAPVASPSPGARRSRSPGTLRDSIVVRIMDQGGSPKAQVGTNDPVGLWVHEGTEAHTIEGNPRLTFYWAKQGKVVSFPRVNHPGTRPNRFLLEALGVLSGL
jgi:hypothetical protein